MSIQANMITTFKGTIDILANLQADERALVEALKEKMEHDVVLLARVCDFLKGKLKDAMAEHFANFSDEGKAQACVEHIVIGMLAGDITNKNIRNFLK